MADASACEKIPSRSVEFENDLSSHDNQGRFIAIRLKQAIFEIRGVQSKPGGNYCESNYCEF
jgi:hypothetical protein